ncbi:MAG: bifunctional [glutamine synthetase] adenylyltransferase/[glutamine synthetase]-adenylyl-L-tyrosine phosphorylase, partial [Pseudomonadota bacterium]
MTLAFEATMPLPVEPLSQEAADNILDDLLTAAEEMPVLIAFLSAETPERRLILSALTFSPFLRDIAVAHPECLETMLRTPPQDLLDTLVEDARHAWKEGAGQAELMSTLRRLKRQLAFSLAIYDLGRILETSIITAWLSAFARVCVSSTVDHLLLSAHQEGTLELADTDAPSHGSGLAVIGMGKLGSSELNYSSDIDLIVVFDPDAGIVKDREQPSDVFSRMVRQMIHILQERTRDGYVFRTDLRLRPDPGSTP